MYVGLINKNYVSPFEGTSDAIGNNQDSFCWYYGTMGDITDVGQSNFGYNNKFEQIGKHIEFNLHGNNDHDNDGNDINSYFMIEINLIRNKFTVLIPAMKKDNKYKNQMMQFEIPKQFTAQMPFRVAVTLNKNQMGSTGLGLVRVNPL